MTDDQLDDLLRDHVQAQGPRPALLASLVTASRPRRAPWERWVLGLAVAALAAVVLAPWISDRLPGDTAGSAVERTVEAPAGTRTVALPNEVAPLPGFPEPGDRVSVLATVKTEGNLETMTLLRDALVIGLEPVRVAVDPSAAERLVLAQQEGRLAIAVHAASGVDVVVHREDGLPLKSGDRVDLLITLATEGVLQTRTLLTDALVVDADGNRTRLRVTPEEAEAAVLAEHTGRLTATLRP